MKLSAKALQLKSPRPQEAVPCFEVAGMSPEPVHCNALCEAEGTLWVASKVAGTRTHEGRVSITTSGVTLSSQLGGCNEPQSSGFWQGQPRSDAQQTTRDRTRLLISAAGVASLCQTGHLPTSPPQVQSSSLPPNNTAKGHLRNRKSIKLLACSQF